MTCYNSIRDDIICFMMPQGIQWKQSVILKFNRWNSSYSNLKINAFHVMMSWKFESDLFYKLTMVCCFIQLHVNVHCCTSTLYIQCTLHFLNKYLQSHCYIFPGNSPGPPTLSIYLPLQGSSSLSYPSWSELCLMDQQARRFSSSVMLFPWL